MTDYDIVRNIAEQKNYHQFTELQNLAFRDEHTFKKDCDLMIVGETSTGKTLIPILLYAKKLQESPRGYIPKMLFVVPYRALAAQKCKEIREFFLGQDLNIVLSTGEYRKDDVLIQRGQVDIAVIITEKVYKYTAKDSSFLRYYDQIVLDEIGLLNDEERGIRIDYIIAWAKSSRINSGTPRIISLGTPSYDWSRYCENFSLYPLIQKKRPVILLESTIIYSKIGISNVYGDTSLFNRTRFLTEKEANRSTGISTANLCPEKDDICPVIEPARSNNRIICPYIKKVCAHPVEIIPEDCHKGIEYVLVKICRKHLELNHQIVIFINDREQVKRFSATLYRNLHQYLDSSPSNDICKRNILKKCDLDEEDLYGILETDADSNLQAEYYKMIYSGIAFHSAELPSELRSYIEDGLLLSRKLKIVCSTETLAFGVNSSVDVVVIVGLNKNVNSGVRELTLNEYRNYIGRAGRLQKNKDIPSIKGYTYTLITTKQEEKWRKLQSMIDEPPETIYSSFTVDLGQKIPFLLLNLLSTSINERVHQKVLVSILRNLPQDGSISDEELMSKVNNGLNFLQRHKLVDAINNGPIGRSGVINAKRYGLTKLGKSMRGYVITRDDYESIMAATREYAFWIYASPDMIRFLYNLLGTKQAENGLNTVFSESKTRFNIKEVKNFLKSKMINIRKSAEWIDKGTDHKRLFVLAAIVSWSEGDSAKNMYEKYGVHFALLSKVTEQVAYMIEIAAELLPSIILELWGNNKKLYEALEVTYEDMLSEINTLSEGIHRLYVSIYYGINVSIHEKLMAYLNKLSVGSEEEQLLLDELLSELSLDQINPKRARKIRKIVTRFRFFEHQPLVGRRNSEQWNNYINQRQQYINDIKRMNIHIDGFFRAFFGKDFDQDYWRNDK